MLRMRICHKMAELQFEAPLATFETEEWNDFNDFQIANSEETKMLDNENKDSSDKLEQGASENFGESETISGSLQDLVKSLDEKITNCFCNYEEKVERFAPVQIRSQEEIMTDCQILCQLIKHSKLKISFDHSEAGESTVTFPIFCQHTLGKGQPLNQICLMWWTITGNFGNLLPIDWSKSYARQLQAKALNLGEKREPESQNLDLSDDEELAQAMDFHSMIINSHHHDPEHIVTADEVISELETMMEDSDCSSSAEPEYLDVPVSPYTKVKESLSNLPNFTEEEMKGLSNTALNELLNDYELTIKELSEILVQELALRDELEYDKELKNQFISLLLMIQKRRRECNVDKKKRRSKNHVNNNMPTNNNNNNPSAEAEANSAFLTTVIPYHPNQGPPSSEQLQIYIKILQAIREDSPTVPTLLTDYILKVLCPT